ncbi:hypothetical protein Droror1_Dr00021434 [Drosera rotundifolia]
MDPTIFDRYGESSLSILKARDLWNPSSGIGDDRVFTPCCRDKRSNSNSNPNRHRFSISLPSGGFKVVPFLPLMETPQIWTSTSRNHPRLSTPIFDHIKVFVSPPSTTDCEKIEEEADRMRTRTEIDRGALSSHTFLRRRRQGGFRFGLEGPF